MFNYRISDLPPVGKLFVGLFTTLMLLVCLWAVGILYVDKGIVDNTNLPEYLSQDDGVDEIIQEETEQLAEDTAAVLAPVWDSEMAGEELPLDSTAVVEQLAEHEKEEPTVEDDYQWIESYREIERIEHLRRNVGLAHTHINGQTLLFFCLGLVFLFTSVKLKIKKLTLWIFGITVVTHVVGLSGEGFHWFFDDILAVSGVTILVVIAYMALMIYADLAKPSNRQPENKS